LREPQKQDLAPFRLPTTPPVSPYQQGGRLPSDWLAAFDRNRWPPSVGIGGPFASDSASGRAETARYKTPAVSSGVFRFLTRRGPTLHGLLPAPLGRPPAAGGQQCANIHSSFHGRKPATDAKSRMNRFRFSPQARSFRDSAPAIGHVPSCNKRRDPWEVACSRTVGDLQAEAETVVTPKTPLSLFSIRQLSAAGIYPIS
ncbi:MAG: hypothetical protein QOI93_5649, partial [Rhodospirillaceae bacterium]|nr:hypothetical protein [Rhodospirillaceae bacterium]